MSVVRLASVALVLTGLVSCQERYEPDPKFAPASGEIDELDRAPVSARLTRSIADTHCDMEALCDHLGPGKRYPDRPACLASVGPRVAEELGLSECAGTIDPDFLSFCLNSIRMESCSSGVAEIALLPACAPTLICRR